MMSFPSHQDITVDQAYWPCKVEFGVEKIHIFLLNIQLKFQSGSILPAVLLLALVVNLAKYFDTCLYRNAE